MGYQYNGKCFPTGRDALNSFLQGFPTKPDSQGNTYSVNEWSIWLTHYPVDDGWFDLSYFVTPTMTNQPAQIQFLQCDDLASVGVFDKYPIQDISFTAFITLALIMGFSLGGKR